MSNEEYWASNLEELLRYTEKVLHKDNELRHEWTIARNLIMEDSEILIDSFLMPSESSTV